MADPKVAEKTHEHRPEPIAAETPRPRPVDKPKAKPAEERYFQPREVRQNEWHVLVDSTVAKEDLLRREFWAYVARKIRPGDKVVVFNETRTMYAEMVNFAVGGNWAEMRFVVGPVEVGADIAGQSIFNDYLVVDLGEIKHFSIIRRADGHEIKADGSLRTKDEADKWLGEFIRMEGRRVAA